MAFPERDAGEPEPRRNPTRDRGIAADQRRATATPARGWLIIVLAVFYGISKDRIFLIAAGVTFYTILALFPGIGALVSMYGLFANPHDIAAHLDMLAGFAPGGGVDVLREELTRLGQQDAATLGFGFAVSLAVALWSANAGVSGLFTGLDAVYEEAEHRNLIAFYATTFAFTLGAITLVLLVLIILVALPFVLDHFPGARSTAALLTAGRWPTLFVVTACVLAVIYRYGPCRRAPRWHRIIGSSILAAMLWLGASVLFSWYVAKFGSYNKTYGSLGAVFGFMTWIWVSMVVVLVGAKLDAVLERHSHG
jgi:membrane protein